MGSTPTTRAQRARYAAARKELLEDYERSGLSATAYAKQINRSHTAVLVRLARARQERSFQQLLDLQTEEMR